MMIQILCPHCSTAASAFLIHAGDHTIWGAATRHYFCSCVNCAGEFEVIDFADDKGRWNINKYRAAAGDNEWTVVQDLPDESLPLVVTGPGGEYYKAVRIKEGLLDKFFRKAVGFKQCFNPPIPNVIKKAMIKKTEGEGLNS